MDVKNVLKAVVPLSLRARDKIEKTIKSDSTTDRDGNGQMPSGGQSDQDHSPLSDEEFAKCLEHLKAMTVVKDHNLRVEVQISEGRRFVLLKEANGKIVRRISDLELRSLAEARASEKGQLLRKTA